jgi:hypothetical protein
VACAVAFCKELTLKEDMADQLQIEILELFSLQLLVHVDYS